ncbi:FAD-binding oxidoreductase [Aliikangiella marina]|uniref:FAD-binding oxidoreductase n=1 Tax=Aliikangiella marina TaxID=1712262 RepID=A0A545TE80_9GAMM|nr:FAD-binding oxidoreductase [Aliikangiella marina]TQV75533.1 FAD-binding oxidoreductase [Aliikangiella marina]
MSSISSAYIQSYYSDTLNYDADYPQLVESIEVDACIIGGGYAGLMTAIGLIDRGYTNIALVESEKVGWGASGRNGGFVFGGYSLGPRALVKQVGPEAAQSLYRLTTAAVDLIRRRVSQYEIDCDLVDEGVIWANWFKDQRWLIQEQRFMKEFMNTDWEYLSPQELSQRIQSERYCGGLYEPNAMHFHPLNYAAAIAKQVKSGGGLIFENSRVVDLQTDAAEKRVVTENGSIRCKHLVIAAGGYIGNICPPVARSILPIATYVMTTEPLGSRLQTYLKTRSAIYDTRFAFDYYRPLNDGRVLWGGRISANTSEPRDLGEELRQDMLRVFPDFEDVKIERVWSGWMGYARHQMAQIGQLKPGVWYGIGFGGHGVAPTTAAGEIIAAAISQQDQSYKQFKPWGLPWNGSLFGPAAAQMSYWWYQLKDWLKDISEN